MHRRYASAGLLVCAMAMAIAIAAADPSRDSVTSVGANISRVRRQATGLRICFQETEGSSQCQGSRSTCSGYSSNPSWYRLCFQETEASSQCQGTRSSCTAWGSSSSWTAPFRDDTDGNSGGCTYQWMIQQTSSANVAPQLCAVCFQETEASTQCQGSRNTCSGYSNSPSWTAPFRDDTDNRGGGCYYQWRLVCQSAPTFAPTRAPTFTPTRAPTFTPTRAPTFAPTRMPTFSPTRTPTARPTFAPTRAPTFLPTRAPTFTPTRTPTARPTPYPTAHPCVTGQHLCDTSSTYCTPDVGSQFGPTLGVGSSQYTCVCLANSGYVVRLSNVACGTEAPTSAPTATPTTSPTAQPTALPTLQPTAIPTASPTASPTAMPTAQPTALPTPIPTAAPTAIPTASPTATPTASPTATPTLLPTASPTASPTRAPVASSASAVLWEKGGVNFTLIVIVIVVCCTAVIIFGIFRKSRKGSDAAIAMVPQSHGLTLANPVYETSTDDNVDTGYADVSADGYADVAPSGDAGYHQHGAIVGRRPLYATPTAVVGHGMHFYNLPTSDEQSNLHSSQGDYSEPLAQSEGDYSEPLAQNEGYVDVEGIGTNTIE